MTTISDEQLFTHGARAKGKVVVLTGGANGIGKETAALFARHGAKVVIGDLDVKGSEAVVEGIKSAGGDASFIQCNVTKWDNLVALFEHAIERYGVVDIVIPNAGIAEGDPTICSGTVAFKDGKPVPPKLSTIDINLTAVVHTVHLGLHYMKQKRTPGDWKAVVLIGSMASWQGIPKGPMYSAAKHAILGLMRSIYPELDKENIRVSVIHPWFADTKILPLPIKVVLAGIPLTPVPRIAGAIFYSATDPDKSTSGCPWLLPDDGPVFLLPKEELKLGVYGMIDQRAKRLAGFGESVKLTVALARDLLSIFKGGLFVITVAAAAAAYYKGAIKLPL